MLTSGEPAFGSHFNTITFLIYNMYMTRLAVPDDAKYLPAVELSAGQTFANHEKYRWVAEGKGKRNKNTLLLFISSLNGLLSITMVK